METVRFYTDPACPWAWQTAKWMREVQQVRPVEVQWKPFSLKLTDDPADPLTDASGRSTPALRTMALVDRELGNAGMADLYFAVGARVHESKERLSADVVSAALGDAGLDASLLERALADPTTAADVRASHFEAVEQVEAFGVPTIVLASGRGMFGPVVSVAPTGEGAGELWDHARWLVDRDGFFELKRERDRRPGEERPVSAAS